MPRYETPEVKSDEPSGTEQLVCEDCKSGVTGRVTPDAAGVRTASYSCPNCGHRLKTKLERVTGGA